MFVRNVMTVMRWATHHSNRQDACTNRVAAAHSRSRAQESGLSGVAHLAEGVPDGGRGAEAPPQAAQGAPDVPWRGGGAAPQPLPPLRLLRYRPDAALAAAAAAGGAAVGTACADALRMLTCGASTSYLSCSLLCDSCAKQPCHKSTTSSWNDARITVCFADATVHIRKCVV